MGKDNSITLFEDKKIRSAWNEEEEEWYFSVVDVIEILTDSTNPTDYLKKLRKRDILLGDYIGTNCPQVAMTTETGKQRKTLAANTAQLFRIIQSIPSKKENLRDNMTNKELVLNMLAELSTKEISETSNPETLPEHEDVAKRGGNIAKEARLKLEAETGKKDCD